MLEQPAAPERRGAVGRRRRPGPSRYPAGQRALHVRGEPAKPSISGVNDRLFRLGDVAPISRGYVDPPQPMFRYKGQPAIGLAIGMKAKGRHPAARQGPHGAHARDRAPTCRSESTSTGSPNQPAVVEEAVGGFTEALLEAVVIVLGGELPQPRIPYRAGGGAVNPTGAGRHLLDDGTLRHRPAAHLARCPDHLARPAGRRRHISVEMMATKWRRAGTGSRSGDLRLHSTAFPMLTGTLVTVAAFVPIGLERLLRRRVHVFDVRRGRRDAADLLGGGGAVHAAVPGVALLPPRRRDCAARPSRLKTRFRPHALPAMRGAG